MAAVAAMVAHVVGSDVLPAPCVVIGIVHHRAVGAHSGQDAAQIIGIGIADVGCAAVYGEGDHAVA